MTVWFYMFGDRWGRSKRGIAVCYLGQFGLVCGQRGVKYDSCRALGIWFSERRSFNLLFLTSCAGD